MRPPEIEQEAARLFREGLTYSEVAAAMPEHFVSRNAVASLLYKLSVKTDGRKRQHSQAVKRAAASRRKGRTVKKLRRTGGKRRSPGARRAAQGRSTGRRQVIRAAKVYALPLPETPTSTLADVKPKGCRFPYGDPIRCVGVDVCGRDAMTDRSYCAAHFALCINLAAA